MNQADGPIQIEIDDDMITNPFRAYRRRSARRNIDLRSTDQVPSSSSSSVIKLNEADPNKLQPGIVIANAISSILSNCNHVLSKKSVLWPGAWPDCGICFTKLPSGHNALECSSCPVTFHRKCAEELPIQKDKILALLNGGQNPQPLLAVPAKRSK